MKILVSKFNMIGDVLFSTTLLRNLKTQYPDSSITFTTYDFSSQILKNNECVDRTVLYKKRKGFLRYFWNNLLFYLYFIFHRHDLYLCLRHNSRSRFIGLLTGAHIRLTTDCPDTALNNLAYTSLPCYVQKHSAEQDLNVLKQLGLPQLITPPEINWTADESSNTLPQLPSKPFVHLHPVARWRYKELPAPLMAQIIDYLYQRDLEVVITSSSDPTELEMVKQIINACQAQPTNLAGTLSLQQLSLISSRSIMFIGTDTAAMHIATSVNTPVLAFFGPTPPKRWGPWDYDLKSNTYENNCGPQGMGKHHIVQAKMECVPCDKQGCDNQGESKCLSSLTFDEIKPSLDFKLKEIGSD